MNVTFQRVEPGIALSAGEADRLKGQIGALVEGMSLSAGQSATIPDFKDDRSGRRRVKFTVVDVDGQNARVDLVEMT